MSIDKSIIDWREEGKHLPSILRDFHDQKDVFKLVHALTREKEESAIRRPTWVEGQVYVIDTFLWCMARHGYTLQRSRARLPFESLEENIKAMKAEEADSLRMILGMSKLTPASATTTQSEQP